MRSVPRLYRDLAHLWPRMSPPEDYAPEAAQLRGLLDAAGCRSLVEFGAGGGHTLVHLAPHYECLAVDLSPAMLAQCRRLNPAVPVVAADMRTVRLARTFDAVLIHDAIDYMVTPDDVRRTLATAAGHLDAQPRGSLKRPRRGGPGLALIAPTYTAETFTDGETEHDQRDGLAYDAVVHRTGEHTFDLAMTYHVAGEAIEDLHRCGLFPRAFWLDAMRDAGFHAEHVPTDAWELFHGIRTD